MYTEGRLGVREGWEGGRGEEVAERKDCKNATRTDVALSEQGARVIALAVAEKCLPLPSPPPPMCYLKKYIYILFYSFSNSILFLFILTLFYLFSL